MGKIIIIITLLLGNVVASRWHPAAISELTCQEKEVEPSYIVNENVYKSIGLLDRFHLSRVIATSVIAHHDQYRLPVLTSEWEYMKPQPMLDLRLQLYGMSIAKLDVRGNGNCFYFSLEVAFIKYGLSIDVLRKLLNDTLLPSIRSGILGMKTARQSYYTALELKRIVYIGLWGFNPDVEESVKQFNAAHFKEFLATCTLMRQFWDADKRNPDYARYEKYDYVAAQKEFDEYTGPIEDCATKIFNETLDAEEEQMAYLVDVHKMEEIFNFKTILFGMGIPRMTCGERLNDNRKVNFFVMLYYAVGFHRS